VKRKRRKVALFGLSMVICASLLVACSGRSGGDGVQSGEAGASDSGDAGAGTASAEPVTLKIFVNLNPEINLKDNPVVQQAEKLAHVKLDIEAPPQNGYWDRMKVVLASGDLPDLFWYGTDTDFENYSKQGMLATLDDKIGNYPNLMANISKEQWGDARALVDGKIHAVPRPNSYDRWGYLINQKWLDKLHLKAPTTVDEFVEVCRAFTKDDPDGNGKDDTYGFSTAYGDSGLWTLRTDFFLTAYSLSAHWGMPASDGKFYARQTSPDYLPMITKIRDMYKEGIIDRDMITHKNNEQEEKFAQGKVGIIGMSDKGVNDYLEKYHLNPADYTFHAPLKNLATGESIYMMPPSNWGAYLIPANSKHIDEALKFLDWANTEEGFKLFQLGIQGIHYNSYDIDKRIVDRTPEQVAALQTVTSNNFAFANAYKGRPVTEGGNTEAQREKFAKEALAIRKDVTEYYVPFVKQVNPFIASIPDVASALSTMETRYITGDISEEEFRKFIDEKYRPLAAKVEQDYNAFMAANPIVKKKGVE